MFHWPTWRYLSAEREQKNSFDMYMMLQSEILSFRDYLCEITILQRGEHTAVSYCSNSSSFHLVLSVFLLFLLAPV